MTTINDRIDHLEDTFNRAVPLLETIVATQAEHTAVLNQHTAVLNQHTDKLDAIITTLGQQSIEIELIKGYVG